ncbi:PREDICTED: prostaglandin reductase 1-like [Priapulus caudatus]|uniref:Prostaglandin reductase 1-like n=1 Tax=Priapulus caudatus TaxID=37621 RepID=A0ABM1E4F2_PRICU|nr:PREDICTED: prostaglandin reductase 1-like [Priapulus caudatus]
MDDRQNVVEAGLWNIYRKRLRLQSASLRDAAGCKVIAFTGSDRKVQWLRNNTRADHVFNYKKVNIQQAISEAAPEGVDCFFDNVAGEFASKVYSRMKTFGRIACCGFISHYNKDFRNLELATMVQGYMIASQLKCEGFQVDRYEGRFDEARKQVVEWMDKVYAHSHNAHIRPHARCF